MFLFKKGLSFIEEMASQYETDIRIDLTAADNDHLYEAFENFSLSSYPEFTLHLGRETALPLQGLYSVLFYLNLLISKPTHFTP